MATRPQLLAATLVVLMASSARAQQYYPMSGGGYGPGSPSMPQVVDAAAQFPFVAQSGAPMVCAPQGMDQGGIQLATVSLPDSPARTAPPAGGMAIPANPGFTTTNPVYTQEPTQDFGMPYGPGPQMQQGYPMPAAGAAPYGGFPMPEPVTPRCAM